MCENPKLGFCRGGLGLFDEMKILVKVKPIISKEHSNAKNDVFYVFLNAFPYFKRKTMIRICFRISRTFAKDLSSGFSIKGPENFFWPSK